MHFLFEGMLPEDEVERLHVEWAANFFQVIGDKLYVVGKHGVLCVVPPIAKHWGIVDSVDRLSHSHPDTMYATLCAMFYWKGMRADLHEFCAKCEACQQEHAKFRDHKYLHPIWKLLAPFLVWAIDLIVGLPLGRYSATVCVMVIDVFSKFLVMTQLPNKEALTLVGWFYECIVCEYGCPLIIRTNQGTEFWGHFDQLLA